MSTLRKGQPCSDLPFVSDASSQSPAHLVDATLARDREGQRESGEKEGVMEPARVPAPQGAYSAALNWFCTTGSLETTYISTYPRIHVSLCAKKAPT